MALYESTFITRQDISPKEVEKIGDNLAKIVEKKGGKIVKREYWGLRNLAYNIKKNKKGHYVMFGIDAEAVAINELERQYGLNESIIRNLTIRVEDIPEGPSFILKNSDDAGEKAPSTRKPASNSEEN